MNKRILIAAVAAAASGIASAQSNVQIYGILDAGIEHVTNANSSGGGKTLVSSGGSNNSRLGFKGAEDLGGGLKAIFNSGASDGPLFRRQANVGLQGRFGRVIVGRSFTTVYDFVKPFDPMSFAPRYSWATAGSGTLSSKYGMATAFDNMVKYQGDFGGLKVGVSYGAGEVAGSEADGRKISGAAAYETGPLSFVVAAERINGTSNTAGLRSVTKTYHVGAAYKVTRNLGLKLGYRDFNLVPAGKTDVHANTWWMGGNYQLTQAIDLTGAVYRQNIKDGVTITDSAADPTMFVFRTKYALSKRSSLYATAAHAKARNGVPVGVSRDSSEDGGVTGFSDHQNALMLGFQHRF
jgi:predicted porin